MELSNNTQNMPSKIEQEGLLHRITNRIRQSLELQEILISTVAEIRSFLETDRVKVYQFHADGSGQVIAESIYNNRLPSLLGLNFPADDIPPHAREMFIKARGRSIVDLATGKIGISQLDCPQTGIPLETQGFYYREVDPCHIEYLTAMGVQSSLVVPILQYDVQAHKVQPQLWGLLVSHNTQTRTFSERELQIVQLVADQVSIAIAQSNLLRRAREQAIREAKINRVATLLHTLPSIEVQQALIETVAAFKGSGGRLYIAAENASFGGKQFTCGAQPILVGLKKDCLLEESLVWQQYFKLQDPACNSAVAIRDIYKEPGLRVLAAAFRPTKIRGMIVIPLEYRQGFLGYLSVFRDEIETETLWAGRFDSDERQWQPRNSFEAWLELKKGQACEWTKEDIELAAALANHFAMAIEQYELYRQVKTLNTNLECQVQERTQQLQQSLDFAKVLKQVTDQIRSTLDLQTILKSIVREVRELLTTDRVVIYQFTKGYQGEVVVEDVKDNATSILGDIYDDKCFPLDYAYRYQKGRVRAINNVLESDLDPCHIKFLQNIQVQANLVVSIRMGDHLWGLLTAHECFKTRIWQEAEIELLQQLADQAAIAIQQAELYQQSRAAADIATQKAQQLEQAAEQQEALFAVVTKIRESLDLETIFKATTTEVRQLLEADRVAVFCLYSASGSENDEFVSEDVLPEFKPVLGTKVYDRHFSQHYAHLYQQGRIQIVDDIYNAGLNDCHIQLLEQFQVRANLVVPLLKGDLLWGLLCIHQCSQSRHWDASAIDFVNQIAAQLGIAIQQAELLTQTQEQTEQLSCTIKELQQTQTQLIQTEKMSSLGQLVAGVAHEVNNPVNFIYGNLAHVGEYAQDLLDLLHLYQRRYPHPDSEILKLQEEIDLEFLADDLPKMLSSMKVGADRIRQLVLSLRNFSRLDQAEMKLVDIHEGLDSTLLILQHRLKGKGNVPSIEVVKSYGDLPLVECYAGQLNQVFMNVISNAIDALDMGTLDLGLAEESAQSAIPTIQISTKVRNGDRALIQISDNGSGMPEGVRSQIFNPFFTTKPVGKGTGLGLSISYQIVVEKHGGVFQCSSLAGKGTQFWIEIPIQQAN